MKRIVCFGFYLQSPLSKYFHSFRLVKLLVLMAPGSQVLASKNLGLDIGKRDSAGTRNADKPKTGVFVPHTLGKFHMPRYSPDLKHPV
ncbi:hypothetical protein U5801_25475 [Lamprobacter modestohalophilus]|uniref:hypothetical protein n=1 Tax=Lamprobacter modestohalophilus TaxID=1064514 RepID=UPI002ADEE9CA|nr:hypothetical protein [Lamprobacter modestohalophilus]MEA1053132.1 hypothetical protein [Lamprobacter modestohalophilus]